MPAQTAAPLVQDNRPTPSTPFEIALHDLLGDYFEAYPVWATAIGYHLVDDGWGDLTDEGRTARLAMLARQRAAFEALDPGSLSADEQVDRGIVLEQLEQLRFDEETLREASWDPLSWVYLLGSGLFGLLAREYAPWAHRAKAFLGRVRAMPDVLNAAAARLSGLEGRPVSLLHTETALAQLGGVGDLVNEGLAEARRRAEAGEAPDLVAELEKAAATTHEALERFRGVLDGEVRERAEGEGRLGAELFGRKLRHTLSSDLSADELRSRAWRDYELVRAEMVRLARDQWPQMFPGEAALDDAETVRRVLDRIAQEHRAPHELLEWCQAEVKRIEAFCRERNVIGLADEPLGITWTPVFMRAYGRAFLDSPGPLDRGERSYFWITPPDETGPPEDVESYLREDNDRMLRLLCIHEGVPGHYLQLAWSNRSPSLARSVFSNGMFAEGWAVYVTQVMMDLGFDADDPALMLTHWKFYLRAITNAIMDVEIHTGDMDEAAAMELMVEGGFQEPDEARAKWLRARLASTQLCTYYLGSSEMWDVEVAARRRAAVAAGADAESVPARRIGGVLGETPGFNYRAHLEAAISHGTPPIKWLARILDQDGNRPGA